MAERIAKAANDFDAGLSDDLNTAVALAAMFDLSVKATSPWTKASSNNLKSPARRTFLAQFDQVFAVIQDDDAAKLKALGFGSVEGELSDGDVEKLIAERNAARPVATSPPAIASAKSLRIVV